MHGQQHGLLRHGREARKPEGWMKPGQRGNQPPPLVQAGDVKPTDTAAVRCKRCGAEGWFGRLRHTKTCYSKLMNGNVPQIERIATQ
jgi:hypothetical protein